MVVSGDDEAKTFETIVGVVANIRQAGIDKPAGTELFFTIWQVPQMGLGTATTGYVVLRTRGAPAAMAPLAEQALRELDPGMPASDVRTMDRVLWEAVARPRFLTFLLAAFAALALALAAIGIYGVMSYTVAQRTHELGIRAALGAQAGQLRMMVLKQGAVVTGLGVGVGLLAALVVQQVLDAKLATTLYGERLRDPLLFVEVTAVIVGVALLATWLPARRATRVPPTVALRSE